jgi:hypothetical protein
VNGLAKREDVRIVLKLGDTVRLIEPASGMATGSEGTLLGWYAREIRQALVRWAGGPLGVPADTIEKVQVQALRW